MDVQTGIDAAMEQAVASWLEPRVPGLAPPLQARQLVGGRSNPTFLLTDRVGLRLVLRTPPAGRVLATAHDVLREARIQAALAPTEVPVPEIVAKCADESIIGVPFMVASFVEGAVLRTSAAAASVSDGCRHAVGFALVDALAGLHRQDPVALGLGDLMRGLDYVPRQVRRWSRQVESGGGRHRDALLALGAEVERAVPAQRRATLVHGDPKLDNCIVSPSGRIRALVDWELAAVGDPVADLALALAYWAEPADEQFALQDPPTRVAGFATRQELIEHYARASGVEPEGVGAYLAFSYWKLACIVAGVATRDEAAGSSAAPEAVVRSHDQVTRLAALARSSLGQPHIRGQAAVRNKRRTR